MCKKVKMESENKNEQEQEQERIANRNTFPSEESGENDLKPEEDSEVPKIEEINVNLDELDEIERKRDPDVDLEQFRLKTAKIEAVESIRINSNYAKAKDGKQHKIMIIGEVVHTLVKEGQEDINFKPTELLDLEEDEEGNLIGLPKWDKSKWQRFKRTLNIKKPSEAIGKELPMSINHNKKTDKDYLGFMY